MATQKHIDHIIGMTVYNFLNPNNTRPSIDELNIRSKTIIAGFNKTRTEYGTYSDEVTSIELAVMYREFLSALVINFIDIMAVLDIEYMND